MLAPRIPIQFTIFLNKNEKMSRTSTFTKRSILTQVAPIISAQNGKFEGYIECTFWYSKSKGVFNSFIAHNMKELKDNIDICTEPGLIQFLKAGNLIDKKCLYITAKPKRKKKNVSRKRRA